MTIGLFMSNTALTLRQRVILQDIICSYRRDDYKVVTNSIMQDGSHFVVLLHENSSRRLTLKATPRAIETRVDGVLKSVTPWKK